MSQDINMGNNSHNTITLRSVYKIKEYTIQPVKLPNGTYPDCVKRVDSNGDMILSEAEKADPNRAFFIREDEDINVTDGTTFNLDNPYDKNRWEAIKRSYLIVESRNERDKEGNLKIDGGKQKYGLAELFIDRPGEESKKSISRKKLIINASKYIMEDSIEGRLLKVKLLGKQMKNAPASDIEDFLYQKAEKDPNAIINLYTDGDTALKLLLLEAREKRIIYKDNGVHMYGDLVLGITDDAIIAFLKSAPNAKTLESLKNETFPDFVKSKIEESKEDKKDKK